MGGRGSGSRMASSSAGGGRSVAESGVIASSDKIVGTPPSAQQAADDMYDELTNHAYQPRAAEFAADMVINGENDLNWEMGQRYGYRHASGMPGETDLALIRAQQEGARRWISENPDKMNRAIKKSDYEPEATRLSMASPFSKSPDSAPAGTVLRMGDWKYTKSKSGGWSASKGGKRQPGRTNEDIKRVFS